MVVAENIGRRFAKAGLKKLVHFRKCIRSVRTHPITELLFRIFPPQQRLCIGELVGSILCIPRCFRIVESYRVCFPVKSGYAVFITVNTIIFVEILDIYAVIRNVKIITVIADKTDGIYKSPCLKSKEGIRSAGFGMKPYLSFLGKITAGIGILYELSERIQVSID